MPFFIELTFAIFVFFGEGVLKIRNPKLEPIQVHRADLHALAPGVPARRRPERAAHGGAHGRGGEPAPAHPHARRLGR